MNNFIKLIAVAVICLTGCKKQGLDTDTIETQSKFSYSGYAIEKNAEVTSELFQDHLTFTFTKPGMEVNLPHLIVQISNFKGPGTYGSSDGVTIYGLENNDDTYWHHNFDMIDPQVRSHAKVLVKRADTYLTAELEGELVHEEFAGNKLVRMYTPFKGSTHQTLFHLK